MFSLTSRSTCLRSLTLSLLGTSAGLFVGGAAFGQTYGEERVAELLTDVGIEQHLEAQLPLDTTFTGVDGQAFELRSAFDGTVPVILTLNYFDCPQLCSLQLSNLAAAMGSIGLDLGTDYRVVTLSIDPNDTPARMSELRARYLVNYLDASKEAGEKRDDEQAKDGWVCLTGTKVQIDRVAETAGFGYSWVEEKQEYAHQAANILCSPSGQIMRYLEGVDPSLAGVLRLSLVEASEGKVGSLYDGIFLNCFIYDSSTGQYTPAVMQLLKVAAALTVLAVVTGFFFMKRGEAQHAVAGPEWASDSDAASASEKTS